VSQDTFASYKSMSHADNIHALALAQCRVVLGERTCPPTLIIVGTRPRRDGRWTVTVRVHFGGLEVTQAEPHIVVVVGTKGKAAAAVVDGALEDEYGSNLTPGPLASIVAAGLELPATGSPCVGSQDLSVTTGGVTAVESHPTSLIDFSPVMELLSLADNLVTLGYNQRAEEQRAKARNLAEYLNEERVVMSS